MMNCSLFFSLPTFYSVYFYFTNNFGQVWTSSLYNLLILTILQYYIAFKIARIKITRLFINYSNIFVAKMLIDAECWICKLPAVFIILVTLLWVVYWFHLLFPLQERDQIHQLFALNAYLSLPFHQLSFVIVNSKCIRRGVWALKYRFQQESPILRYWC